LPRRLPLLSRHGWRCLHLEMLVHLRHFTLLVLVAMKVFSRPTSKI
jgi:hypothetical protein